MKTKDLKIFSVTFLAGDNTFRQVSGVKLEEEETVQDFIMKRAIPRMRQEPKTDAEMVGEYKFCVATEIDLKDAIKEVTVEKIVEKEVIKELVVNKLEDPKSILRYMRDTYAKKEERVVFNRIIRRTK